MGFKTWIANLVTGGEYRRNFDRLTVGEINISGC